LDLINAAFPYLMLGCVAGLLAGLLGVGGGLVIVPALVFLLPLQGIDTPKLMQIALGTSLATISATSISSIWAHHRQHNVKWRQFITLTPGLILGVMAGSWIADQVNSDSLQIGFSIFVIVVAIQMLLDIKPSGQRHTPKLLNSSIAGSTIGLVSSLVGIGGGTLTTPYLLWHNTPIRQAIGTSAACGLPIALFGSLGYAFVGLDANQLPAYTTGYIYWPALLGIISTSILFAPLGAKLTGIISSSVLKKIFAVVLMVVAIRLLVN